jgi:integrase
MGSVYLRGRTWWIKYYKQGKPRRESSGSSKKGDAERLLKLREGAVAKGEPLSLRIERIKVDELIEDVLKDYEANGKDVTRVRLASSKLLAYFGGMRASNLTTSMVNDYMAKRKGEITRRGTPPSNAMINRELSLLKRAYSLAYQSTPAKVHHVPHIPMLTENNVRTGFIEREDYLALKAAAPDYLKPIITMAYFTGCRRGEILGLKWSQVDMGRRIIRLNPNETKNKQGRTIPLPQELCEALEELERQKEMLWPNVQHVFVRDSKPVREFKRAWQRVCVEIGLGEIVEDEDGKKRYEGLLFHDLRRSAVRNLVRSGVPERVAMAISGHKTRSVFERYNIVSEGDLTKAAEALDKYHASMGTILGDVESAERIVDEVQRG